ncbi:DNA cross-link repair protein pso2/snm1 [Aaosphaeria arxii CBS 175.79]|uniref:DNA cross-link repair protein pso2/snm1 n=1 Tax=Aaosphaeria arxii CBS 175.79 TaxID=1450172 RepID=A0A6A5Y3P3_9PLEO|nr:DNA cross-link repair protein pso2/snm1 [Aaosphaeria arxii CBS 175.79]KAF2019876.1 DNA cross-link repair protein pso2/snm1 [Aaosphaeria arxii CBS 175.79]
MFRNPRENRHLDPSTPSLPSVGRPPSPPRFDRRPILPAMTTKSSSKAVPTRSKSNVSKPQMSQTTLVPGSWGKKSPANGGLKGKPKAAQNGNIMAFFKKAEEQNNTLFLRERGGTNNSIGLGETEEDIGWDDHVANGSTDTAHAGGERYNEIAGSNKKRKVSEDMAVTACSPPPPEDGNAAQPVGPIPLTAVESTKITKKTGPFLDDSDSETDEMPIKGRGTNTSPKPSMLSMDSKSIESTSVIDNQLDPFAKPECPSLVKIETTSGIGEGDFDDFEGLEEEEDLEGEEYDERRWMEEQQKLEMAQAALENDFDDREVPAMFPTTDTSDFQFKVEESAATTCPICNAPLGDMNEQDILVHVNGCLDGNTGNPSIADSPRKEMTPTPGNGHKMFKRPDRPARPGQDNPFMLGESSVQPKSAFSRLMAGHAEDAAWATAASAESSARGKPFYERTCPFYKILPGFYICVDAFRYGAVKGQHAYFLSHFHSDHYVGLTKSWSHGPIYCSKVTANLVRQQLRVDPKWVIDLEFEKKVEIPGTEGVQVTMIPANHCPGSSLFLFEKAMGKGKNPKLQRVLHCGDFRACQAHIEHPLLKPEVIDSLSGQGRQQKLDVCYLDTTYLNPKYAFPPQEQVIQACADMCVSLNKERAEESDAWEQVKRDRAGQGMVKFVRKDSQAEETVEGRDDEEDRGRLLVVVGTYSIGKERICMGIAKALGSKIYAPPNKQRICHALEDPELDALLTNDPRDAQVHMTPLFEIRAETLDDYLRDYRDCFSRTVGFRPSGWNYRPPKSRFTESPTIQTVLHSENWKSQFTMQDLNPQPGSTKRASCFGVPYSEHSSFRELTMFCCALRIDKIIPTVNVGSAKSREKMKSWCEKWAQEKKKNGLFKLEGAGTW